jgi:hypothetical protein
MDRLGLVHRTHNTPGSAHMRTAQGEGAVQQRLGWSLDQEQARVAYAAIGQAAHVGSDSR